MRNPNHSTGTGNQQEQAQLQIQFQPIYSKQTHYFQRMLFEHDVAVTVALKTRPLPQHLQNLRSAKIGLHFLRRGEKRC